MQDIVSEIQELKKTKKATILAHYYQEGEIQEIADFNGDSLALARAATKVETPIIVFCGVHFMAETAKILNPAKKVLLPDLQAGCSLADSCPADKLNRYQQMLRENGRDFQTVTYINSTADVKALSDWVVTSGNAREIIERVPKGKEILFVPDKHLGQYLEEVCDRKMILWDGACMVHEIFSLGDLLAMKKKVPTSLVFAHPECPANIRANSDFVGGTEAMLKKLASLKNDTDIIVATEPNMMWQMQHRFPMHRYHPVPGITCACNKCPHMARNTLEKIKDCLVNESPEILWKSTFDKAKVVLERSLLN
ncbi:MAG: quinolinate synthase NadA [Planctomycetota bacterium]|jgi:quinolinate synthase